MKALLIKAANREPITVVDRGDVVLLLPAKYTGNGDWVKTPHSESPGGYVIMSLVNSLLESRWISPVEGGVKVVLLGALLGALVGSLVSYAFFWLRIANAGQHPPLLITTANVAKHVRVVGNPLGIFPHEKYKEITVELAPGERLFAFSDGLVEAADAKGNMFTRWGLQDAIKDAAAERTPAMVEKIFATWNAHLAGTPAQDDVTVTVIEIDA